MFDWKQHLKESTCLKYGAKTQRSATSPFTVSAHLTRNIHPYESNNELPRRFLSALVRILNHKRLGICWKKPQFQALHFHLGPHVAVFATVWAPAPVHLMNTNGWSPKITGIIGWSLPLLGDWLLLGIPFKSQDSIQVNHIYIYIYFTHHPPFSGLHPLEEFSISSYCLDPRLPCRELKPPPLQKNLNGCKAQWITNLTVRLLWMVSNVIIIQLLIVFVPKFPSMNFGPKHVFWFTFCSTRTPKNPKTSAHQRSDPLDFCKWLWLHPLT